MSKRNIHYSFRNKIIHSIYAYILKPIFFLFDPEYIHDHIVKVGKTLGKCKFSKWIIGKIFDYKNDILAQKVLGIQFKNPVGLSAGFDKNAELTSILPHIGFGFAELGSITGEACKGNKKPRLWRLKKEKSLLVYYGLKNDGCEIIYERLKDKQFDIPMGISVAMTNCIENIEIENAIKDFAKVFKTMESIGSYITVNISCPNAEASQPFTKPENIDLLFNTLDKIPTIKPIFIKLSPDITYSDLDRILDTVRNHRIHGIICTNLTKKRDKIGIIDKDIPKVGGMSGKVVQGMADDMLSYIYKREGRKFILIGTGGIFTAEDAYRKIKLGATLVQMITGMIYEGPQVISEINLGIVKLLEKDGFTHISQAIGIDV